MPNKSTMKVITWHLKVEHLWQGWEEWRFRTEKIPNNFMPVGVLLSEIAVDDKAQLYPQLTISLNKLKQFNLSWLQKLIFFLIFCMGHTKEPFKHPLMLKCFEQFLGTQTNSLLSTVSFFLHFNNRPFFLYVSWTLLKGAVNRPLSVKK